MKRNALSSSAKPMKTTVYNSLDLIVRPHKKTKNPAKPQNIAKNAGSANRAKGRINVSQETSMNKDAEIQ